MSDMTLDAANKVLLRAGLHEMEVAFIEPGTRRTLALRLRALERVVKAAATVRDAMGACRMPYASDMADLDDALAALESEVAGG